MDLAYADDPNGGPDTDTISPILARANRQIRPQGYVITSTRGPGATYNLVPIERGLEPRSLKAFRP